MFAQLKLHRQESAHKPHVVKPSRQTVFSSSFRQPVEHPSAAATKFLCLPVDGA